MKEPLHLFHILWTFHVYSGIDVHLERFLVFIIEVLKSGKQPQWNWDVDLACRLSNQTRALNARRLNLLNFTDIGEQRNWDYREQTESVEEAWKQNKKTPSGIRGQGSTINLRRNEWKWAGWVHAGLISRWDQVRLSEGKNRDYRREWQAVKWEENWWQGKKEQAMDCWTLWYYFGPLSEVVVLSLSFEFFLVLTRGIWIQVKKVRSELTIFYILHAIKQLQAWHEAYFSFLSCHWTWLETVCWSF